MVSTYRILVVDHLLVTVVSCTIHVESVHVHAVLWYLFYFFKCLFLHHLEREVKSVNGNLVEASVGLEATRHETLWEEHSRNPETLRESIKEPDSHSGHAGNKVQEPARERLKTGVTGLCPVVGYLSVLETQVHGVKVFTHHNEAVDGVLEVA